MSKKTPAKKASPINLSAQFISLLECAIAAFELTPADSDMIKFEGAPEMAMLGMLPAQIEQHASLLGYPYSPIQVAEDGPEDGAWRTEAICIRNPYGSTLIKQTREVMFLPSGEPRESVKTLTAGDRQRAIAYLKQWHLMLSLGLRAPDWDVADPYRNGRWYESNTNVSDASLRQEVSQSKKKGEASIRTQMRGVTHYHFDDVRAKWRDKCPPNIFTTMSEKFVNQREKPAGL